MLTLCKYHAAQHVRLTLGDSTQVRVQGVLDLRIRGSRIFRVLSAGADGAGAGGKKSTANTPRTTCTFLVRQFASVRELKERLGFGVCSYMPLGVV